MKPLCIYVKKANKGRKIFLAEAQRDAKRGHFLGILEKNVFSEPKNTKK